eukprot:73066-Pleurochrysis_carterae.AAC.1
MKATTKVYGRGVARQGRREEEEERTRERGESGQERERETRRRSRERDQAKPTACARRRASVSAPRLLLDAEVDALVEVERIVGPQPVLQHRGHARRRKPRLDLIKARALAAPRRVKRRGQVDHRHEDHAKHRLRK